MKDLSSPSWFDRDRLNPARSCRYPDPEVPENTDRCKRIVHVPAAAPDRHHAVNPALIVTGIPRLVDFLVRTFGAVHQEGNPGTRRCHRREQVRCEGASRARIALRDLRAALRYLPRRRPSWELRAIAVSGLTGEGFDALWEVAEEHRSLLDGSGALVALRAEQQQAWMWSLITERLERAFRAHPDVAARLAQAEADVLAGRTTPPAAAELLMRAFEKVVRAAATSTIR